MGHWGAQLVRLIAVLSIVLVCSRCAEQGSLVSGARISPAASVPGLAPGAPDSAAALANKADQIVDLRIEETQAATLVRVIGNASLQDYEFRRSGETGFILELNGINRGGGLTLLPLSSANVTLADGGAASPGIVQLVGNLRRPLDYYVLDATGDELLLTLYPAREGRSTSESGSLSAPSPGPPGEKPAVRTVRTV